MFLLSQSVLNYNQMFIYEMVHNYEQFDLKGVFDYNPTLSFTELHKEIILFMIVDKLKCFDRNKSFFISCIVI